MSERAMASPARRGTMDARLAWGVAIAAIGPIAIAVLSDPVAVFDPVTWLILGLIGSLVVVGAIIASRVPHNRVGPLLLLAGLLTTLAAVLTAFGERVSPAAHAWPWTPLLLAVQDIAFWYPILVTLIAVPLVFPGSQPPSRRERIVGGALLAAVATATVAYALSTQTVGSSGVANNLYLPAMVPVLETAIRLSLVVIFACAATAAWMLWRRFRGPDPIVHQQTKWLLATVAPAVVALVIAQAPVPEPIPTAGYFVALLATLMLPAAIGIAITRYRLYEIDRIVSRTIAYALVTGILAAVFVGGIIGLQALLVDWTQGGTLAVAVTTLACFALFQPLRGRVQAAVDRRFNRASVDAERLVAEFAGRTRDEVDLDRLARVTREVASGAVQPARSGVWLREHAT